MPRKGQVTEMSLTPFRDRGQSFHLLWGNCSYPNVVTLHQATVKHATHSLLALRLQPVFGMDAPNNSRGGLSLCKKRAT